MRPLSLIIGALLSFTLLVPQQRASAQGAAVPVEKFITTTQTLNQLASDLQKLLDFLARHREEANTFNKLVTAGSVPQAESYLIKVGRELGLRSAISMGILSVRPAIRIVLSYAGASLTVEFRWD